MPTVMNPHHTHHLGVERSGPQKVCLGMGVGFVLIGLLGVMMPGILGMHLSMTHNLIHLGSGAIALWCGFSDSRKAHTFCLTFGAIYGLLGIAGFLIGEPGYPSVGHMEADQNLFRVIPNVLELGTMDHIVHILLSAIFLFTAYVYRKDRRVVARKDNRSTPHSVDDLNRRSTLGTSEIRNKTGERRV